MLAAKIRQDWLRSGSPGNRLRESLVPRSIYGCFDGSGRSEQDPNRVGRVPSPRRPPRKQIGKEIPSLERDVFAAILLSSVSVVLSIGYPRIDR